MNIGGKWKCFLDRKDEGVGERWFERFPASATEVDLPGSLAAQRIGDPAGIASPWTGTIFDRSFFDAPEYATFREPANFRIPFWLQPDTVFVGAAWYRREIELLSGEGGLTLVLERPHWRTTAWIDGRELGSCDSLSVEHSYALGQLSAGRHVLTLRVDNALRVDVGENAHSVSDHTQGNWNGIVGSLRLVSSDGSGIERLEAFPRAETRSVRIRGEGPAGREIALSAFSPVGGDAVERVVRADSAGRFDAELMLGPDAPLWDEFVPALWRLEARCEGCDPRRATFGIRDLSARGGQLAINGRALFLRGVLDCCIYPQTGYPPMEVGEWRRIFATIKAHGFNHVRFHSWCPPRGAFLAGDEAGLYLQVEVPVWPNAAAVLGGQSPAGVGDGRAVDAWVSAEAERILAAYGQHPCFAFFAAGNEPGGPHHREFLARWLTRVRPLATRQLLTGASGWPELPENDFHVIPDPRIHQWGDNLGCRLNAQPPSTSHDYRSVVVARDKPVIAHENGQWSAYPPLGDTKKYAGHLHPKNYEIFSASLHEAGMEGLLPEFVRASGRLQLACYKEEIESALRTPGLGGFQLLGLQDFPGQGTAPVGVLDAFWDSKGYASEEEFRAFCGPSIPLARMGKRCFVTGETLGADVELAHYGASAIESAVEWSVLCAGATIAAGSFPKRRYPVGLSACGRIEASLASANAPCQCSLEVRAGSFALNSWKIWVYPQAAPAGSPPPVLVTSDQGVALDVLARGGTVVYFVPPAKVRGGVALGFTPIFWNTWCTGGQAPHTLGILCDPRHAALADFPTAEHSDWQWWGILHTAAPMPIGDMPRGLRPIVRVIDDWRTNRPLALVFEAKCGPGRVLACSAELASPDPASVQLRRSLLSYAGSSRFRPECAITAEQLASVVAA